MTVCSYSDAVKSPSHLPLLSSIAECSGGVQPTGVPVQGVHRAESLGVWVRGGSSDQRPRGGYDVTRDDVILDDVTSGAAGVDTSLRLVNDAQVISTVIIHR